ncbi:MAG: SusC/RagA family TonB-linked outer membrane protein [Muribaculaceae bacterium]|nr:SusC/RagA family TonB-linked outer membrane protein [Muribaculaceae bacterium]MDE6118571.1 SusC/RagA family TonB-linked outer membrane protein [Muribaculaceae bacterium]
MGKKLLFLMTFLVVSLGLAANVTITGVVLDKADQEPIPGATVQVKAKKGQVSSHATATDVDGRFSLSVPSAGVTLEIKFIGMNTVEVKATEAPMRIEMESNTTQMEEVVVTGMGVQDKRLFSGATTKISADESRLSGVSDVSRSLEGRAAGVSVQNVSGTFGTAPKIRVRGATSIYGSSKPLWVVDGVILEDNVDLGPDELSSGDANTLIASAIAGISADDIESFQILKDGASTSIYGARAMAGVIVVTTKQGTSGRTSINYTGELTYRLKPSYHDFNICNSQEQMGIYKEMEAKGWLSFASLANASTSGVYGTMYKLINTYDPATGKYALANTQSARNAYLRQAEMRNTDWFDLLFNDNIMQTHSVSISGGTDKGNFYSSLSYMNDPGWTKSSQVDRYTFNANASYNLSKTVKVSLRTQDSYRSQKAPGTLSQDIDVVSGAVSRSFDINPYSYALNTSRTTDPNAILTRNYADFNIFDELKNNYIDLTVLDVKFQGELQWKPWSFLTLNALGSIRYVATNQNHYVTDHSNQAEAYRAGVTPENATIRAANPYLYTDPDDPNSLPVSVLPAGGILYHNNRSMKQMDFRTNATFQKTFNRVHMVNAMLVYEISKIDRVTEDFQGWGICYENGNLPFTDWKLFKQMGEENGAYYSDVRGRARSMAYIGTATYGYDSRYILSGTYRYEGSNKLGRAKKSRWLPTWNVSGAWNADNESWFVNPVLATAKLRVSYSLTADAGPADVSNALAIYYPSRPWRQDTQAYEQALYLNSLANSELTYEKKHELNIGADLGFLNNRINLVVDWYTRDNFDLIGQIYTEGVGGEIRKMANVASMKSHGVEFTISTRNIQTREFTWTTDLTFSYAKNKITDLKSRSRIIDLVGSTGFPLEGYPVRSIFSIPFVGLTEDGLPQIINQNGEVTVSDINFQDWENLGFLKYEGPVDPPYTGGFGNDLRWRDFNLNIFLTYAFGNKVRLDPVFAAGYSDLSSMPREFMNRWVQAGDEAHTTIPAIASRRQTFNNSQLSYAYNAYNYSTERIAKGDFIRLKEIALTYNFPSAVTRALRINNASVKLAATNICLLYADKKLNGQDPEFFNAGGVASPNPKQFTFTLRFGL